jgi:hypothetical protein
VFFLFFLAFVLALSDLYILEAMRLRCMTIFLYLFFILLKLDRCPFTVVFSESHGVCLLFQHNFGGSWKESSRGLYLKNLLYLSPSSCSRACKSVWGRRGLGAQSIHSS